MNPKKKIAAIVMMNAMNVAPGRIAEQLLKIVGLAMEESGKQEGGKQISPNTELERFAGVYWSSWGETIVVPGRMDSQPWICRPQIRSKI